jgi:hypothetical protein
VDPPELLPTYGVARAAAKRVDYGLSLHPDEDDEKQINKYLAGMMDETPSLNLSTVPKLWTSPLFCNIEIKKPFGGQDPAPQLGIWCAAGLTKMASLARRRMGPGAPQDAMPEISDRPKIFDDLKLPPIPCWTVDGHRWRLFVARRLSPDDIVCL